MIIVIDAYNVLKQIKQKEITPFERKAFINLLRKYAKQKKHSIVIVFDGGDAVWPMVEKNPPLTIVYSGFRLSADDYIRRYMKEHQAKDMLLVTSDNELKRNARRYEIEVMDSMVFYSYTQPKAPQKEKKTTVDTRKLADTHDPTLDELMFAVEQVPDKDENDPKYNRRSSGFTASKKERKINKKIKKL